MMMRAVPQAYLSERPATITRWYEAVALALAGYGVSEIAGRMGVSRPRVRQMIAAGAGGDFLAELRAERGA